MSEQHPDPLQIAALLEVGGMPRAADVMRRLHAEVEALKTNVWRQAVIDALIVNHILTAEHETNPRKALHDLLCWERQIALDPAVSDDAAKLVKDEREACAQVCEDRKHITPEWQLDQHYNQACGHCAAAIRSRGNR